MRFLGALGGVGKRGGRGGGGFLTGFENQPRYGERELFSALFALINMVFVVCLTNLIRLLVLHERKKLSAENYFKSW